MNKNSIIDFVTQGKDFLSEEGKELITQSPDAAIQEAAQECPDVMNKLLLAANDTNDPYFRRKIIKAL